MIHVYLYGGVRVADLFGFLCCSCCFSCFRLVCLVLSVSLDCKFSIAPLVFADVYLLNFKILITWNFMRNRMAVPTRWAVGTH